MGILKGSKARGAHFDRKSLRPEEPSAIGFRPNALEGEGAQGGHAEAGRFRAGSVGPIGRAGRNRMRPRAETGAPESGPRAGQRFGIENARTDAGGEYNGTADKGRRPGPGKRKITGGRRAGHTPIPAESHQSFSMYVFCTYLKQIHMECDSGRFATPGRRK